MQNCLKLQNIINCIVNLRNIINNHRSSRKKYNIFYVNLNDITECCIVGYISTYSNKDFSPLKNDLSDFQLA